MKYVSQLDVHIDSQQYCCCLHGSTHSQPSETTEVGHWTIGTPKSGHPTIRHPGIKASNYWGTRS